ncbi:Ppx/GppA phosphatase family protein [Selenomonas noxia]|uniref:Ppx/GppA phosphatase family protein n=2 Tax=Selenomonas noxia TaxID=135083 RepID=UPI00288018C4|nr:phosphatase [Selenomonas noxia]
MLHAIIDIGSNTIRMAVYQIEGRQFSLLMKRKHTVGLAGYLENGRLVRAGIEKTVKILRGFTSFIDTFRIPHVHAFATAALRSAVNSRAAVGEIARRTGVQVRIISGDEEAMYDFIGATQNIAHADGIMIDIGGGSTEIVSFAGRAMQGRWSLPLGSLAMSKEYATGLLPVPAECAAIKDAVTGILAKTPAVRDLRARHMVGMGGVLSSASRVHALLHPEETPRLLPADALPQMIAMFGSGRPLTEADTAVLLRAAPDRLHNIVPGMIIASVLAETFAAADIRYSDSGVREGYIWKEIIGVEQA